MLQSICTHDETQILYDRRTTPFSWFRLLRAAGPQDFNILILVEYPNWAAFDNLRDKTDPIVEKVMGTEDQRRTTAVKRLDIREIIGTKTMREITLK